MPVRQHQSAVRRAAALLAGLALTAGSAAAQPLPGLTVTHAPPAPEAAHASRSLQPCPLFLTIDDPAWCSVGLTAEAIAAAARQDAAGADDARLLSFQDTMTVDVTDPAPPRPYHSIMTEMTGVSPLVFSAGDYSRSGTMQRAYDVPLFGGLQVTGSSAVREMTDPMRVDPWTTTANSGIGVVYEEPGLTIAINPDATLNQSDTMANQMRFGISNRVVAELGPDLTATFSAVYDSFSHPGDPVQDSSAMHNRIALSWRGPAGYRLGVFGQNRQDRNSWESRSLNGPGFTVALPLGDRLELVTSNEFNFISTSLNEDPAQSRSGYQQNFELLLNWRPAFIAKKAMTVLAGYSLSYDGLAYDGAANPYHTLTRVAVAMRF